MADAIPSGTESDIDEHDEDLELSLLEDEDTEGDRKVDALDGSFMEIATETAESTAELHTCHICQATYNWKTSLSRHLKSHETTKSKTLLICQECAKDFKSKQALRKHRVKAHQAIEEGTSLHTCPYPECKKTFLVKQNLEDHINTHLKTKPYSCKSCDKKFMNRYERKRHEKAHDTHGSHVALQCPKCEKTFAHRSSLGTHKASLAFSVSVVRPSNTLLAFTDTGKKRNIKSLHLFVD